MFIPLENINTFLFSKESIMIKFHLTYIMAVILTVAALSTPVSAESSKPFPTAEAAILMDASTGQVLYSKNSDKRMYPASITKLLTALVAIELLNPADILTFSEDAINSVDYNSSRIGMKPGESISVNDALHGLLLMSANEVANGIAEKAGGSIEGFVELMNERAKSLDAESSSFMNPHGLTDDNHYTTAYDMALITKEVIMLDYFLEIMQHSMHQIQPTNKVDEIRYLAQQHKMLSKKSDARIYREDVIAGKIGYTSKSGHTLVTAARQGERTLVTVIMNVDARNLYTDTKQLLDYGFDGFSSASLETGHLNGELSVHDGSTEVGSAYWIAASSIDCLIPIGQDAEDVAFDIYVPDRLTENSSKGDLVGSVTANLDGKCLEQAASCYLQLKCLH